MRVWFCKIKCPFICFCKPTAAPFKLASTPHIPTFADSDKQEAVNGKEEEEAENRVRSCIRKPLEAGKQVGKKRVGWMDNSGKQLVEIKEFESRFDLQAIVSKLLVLANVIIGSVKQGTPTMKKIAAVVFASFSDAIDPAFDLNPLLRKRLVYGLEFG